MSAARRDDLCLRASPEVHARTLMEGEILHRVTLSCQV